MNWYKISQIENPLNRINSTSFGEETIGEWLNRHNIKVDEERKFIFYHGTLKNISFVRSGSYLAETPEEAIHFAQRDRDISSKDVIIYELHLSPDEINGGVFATLKTDISLG